MAKACNSLGMAFTTFRRRASKLCVYTPNQSGTGINKERPVVYPLDEILEGMHPDYNVSRLKRRLIDNGILEDKCDECGWDKKRKGNKYSCCELHHKDGNNKNHRLKNLQILCPNCHSLTENFRNSKRN